LGEGKQENAMTIRRRWALLAGVVLVVGILASSLWLYWNWGLGGIQSKYRNI
jgi:hypothetical protein